MEPVALASYAFLAGLTLSGLAGSAMQLLIGHHPSFTEPFVSRSHVLRSLLVTVTVGPLMLVNDALAGWRGRHISAPLVASCFLSAGAWALALGVVALGLAAEAVDLLS